MTELARCAAIAAAALLARAALSFRCGRCGVQPRRFGGALVPLTSTGPRQCGSCTGFRLAARLEAPCAAGVHPRQRRLGRQPTALPVAACNSEETRCNITYPYLPALFMLQSSLADWADLSTRSIVGVGSPSYGLPGDRPQPQLAVGVASHARRQVITPTILADLEWDPGSREDTSRALRAASRRPSRCCPTTAALDP